jgi:tetratricopeptide (TPR) repeat protein
MTLYDATMHVPLIFRLPKKLPAGGRVSTNVSLVDLSPTILDLLDVAASRATTGRSFMPALSGREVRGSLCYGATDDPFLENGWAPLRSLTEGDWKYIRTTREELYDLATDPEELRNLATSDPEKLQTMQARLIDFESRLVSRPVAVVQLSVVERRALASLGYAGGANAAPRGPVPESLPDVKDMLPLDIAVEEADKLIKEGALDPAIVQLRTVLRRAPGHAAASWSLAQAMSKQSLDDEAIEVFRALLAARPDCYQGHLGLAITLMKNDLPAAIPEFRKALEIDPELSDAHYNLAQALMQTGQPDDALAHLDTLVELDPRHRGAYQWRAHVLTQMGRIDAAVADYRRVLTFTPESAEAHFNLGATLARQGAVKEAHQHLARAVELDPQSAELQCALGAFLMGQRRYSEAVAHLARALELKPGYSAAEEGLQAARKALAAEEPKEK